MLPTATEIAEAAGFDMSLVTENLSVTLRKASGRRVIPHPNSSCERAGLSGAG
jgi:hypothetical protein